MKKILLLLTAGMMIVSLTACGNAPQSGNADRNTDESSEAPKQGEQPGESGGSLELSEGADTTEPIGQGDILAAYALGRSESDIAGLVPDAELLEGLAVRGSNVDNAENEVTSWLEGLGFSGPAKGE